MKSPLRGKFWSFALTAFVAVSFPFAALSRPLVFNDEYNIDQARDLAKKENKLVIIDFTAKWCEPCRTMDRTTWSDPAVEEWINKYGIALQIDTDQHPALSASMHIRGMPTTVVYSPKKQTTEYERRMGYSDPIRLLNWLNEIRNAEGLVDTSLEYFETVKGKGGAKEVLAREERARELMRQAKNEEATEQFVWLWKNIAEQYPKAMGERNSFLAADMARLATICQTAHQQFMQLRDEAKSKANWQDWVILNDVINDQDKTIEWFDQAKLDSSQHQTIKALGSRLQHTLIEHGRWAEVTALYEDPIAELKTRFELGQSLKQQDVNQFPKDAGQLYAAYLAAQDERTAKNIAQESLRLDNTPAMQKQLVENALMAMQPRLEQLAWLKADPILAAKILGAVAVIALLSIFAAFAIIKQVFGVFAGSSNKRLKDEWSKVQPGSLTDCRVIGGAWRGHYVYPEKWKLVKTQESFEATFKNNHRTFSGNMSDSLGEAEVIGFVKYPTVRFQKTYSKDAAGRNAGATFYYEGSFHSKTEVSGTWYINPAQPDLGKGAWRMEIAPAD